MGEVLRVYTEADYDAMTKVTGSGQTQEWDETSRLGGGGSGDVKIGINNTNAVYAQTVPSLSSISAYRYRFYIDPRSVTIANNDRHSFHELIYSTSSHIMVRLFLKYTTANGYSIDLETFGDANTAQNVPNYIVGSNTVRLEVLCNKATGPASSDGGYKIWVDDTLVVNRTSVDIYDTFNNANRFFIGAISGIDAGTSGNFYWGKLLIRDDNGPIGPVVWNERTMLGGGGSSSHLDAYVRMGRMSVPWPGASGVMPYR